MHLSSNFRNPCMVRSDSPLSNDEIARVAPSIFAEEAHESRSDRYRYIPTVDVLEALAVKASCHSWHAKPAFVTPTSANTPST